MSYFYIVTTEISNKNDKLTGILYKPTMTVLTSCNLGPKQTNYQPCISQIHAKLSVTLKNDTNLRSLYCTNVTVIPVWLKFITNHTFQYNICLLWNILQHIL